MSVIQHNGDVFEIESEPIDVTSISRPDPSWLFIDAAGHEHRWWTDGAPATDYRPEKRYEVPSLRWVIDETGIDEDGYEYTLGHHECVQCAEHVLPRTMADTTTQYIPGLRRYRINGESVSREEFERRAKTALVLNGRSVDARAKEATMIPRYHVSRKHQP
jgi:hypothetical protein